MKPLRIGTRESQLAMWQATLVADMLTERGIRSEFVPVKSDGDTDLKTPLYEMGVQGIFTRSLDIALLENKIDIAVHSYKDVPTMPAVGIIPCAVLKRGNYRDLLVYKGALPEDEDVTPRVIATGSKRRQAQWLHRYPGDSIENLRGNVNTRMKKLEDSDWDGAIFAAAGLERIGLRPANSIELNWMLPAPAQGAIAVFCRAGDQIVFDLCHGLDDEETALCTSVEREFMRELMGGCSVPVSALAVCDKKEIYFRGNVFSNDGRQKAEVETFIPRIQILNKGRELAQELLSKGGKEILDKIRNAG